MERKFIFASLTQPPLRVLKDDPDEMKAIVECPYCHEPTLYGDTVMISGFVGCNHCYFVPGGLLETTLFVREHEYENYREGKFYKDGFLINKRKAEIRNDSKD